MSAEPAKGLLPVTSESDLSLAQVLREVSQNAMRRNIYLVKKFILFISRPQCHDSNDYYANYYILKQWAIFKVVFFYFLCTFQIRNFFFFFSGNFSLLSLGIFFICFFFLACWTYGCGVPSGLFVPALLCGAAYGRFVSTVLYE
jgi:hypothetical protein